MGYVSVSLELRGKMGVFIESFDQEHVLSGPYSTIFRSFAVVPLGFSFVSEPHCSSEVFFSLGFRVLVVLVGMVVECSFDSS